MCQSLPVRTYNSTAHMTNFNTKLVQDKLFLHDVKYKKHTIRNTVQKVWGHIWKEMKYKGYNYYLIIKIILQKKAFLLQAWTGPWGSRRLRLHNF
jgi:hypothetical protein